jgi:ABC-type amino acid transport substrate-binding protein
VRLDGPALLSAMDDAARADAVVIDQITARDARLRGRVRATLVPVEERRFTTEQFAFAVRQGDPDWLGWLNLLLKQEKASGAFHRLAARYNAWFRNER